MLLGVILVNLGYLSVTHGCLKNNFLTLILYGKLYHVPLYLYLYPDKLLKNLVLSLLSLDFPWILHIHKLRMGICKFINLELEVFCFLPLSARGDLRFWSTAARSCKFFVVFFWFVVLFWWLIFLFVLFWL